MKVLGIKIQESTIKKLKEYCKKNGLKMGAFVEIIILEYLRTSKNENR
jgi:hypothetical protein